MTVRTYATDESFRFALEDRVKKSARAQGHLDPTRQRQLLLADRFLARVEKELGSIVVAKGGVALKLRLPEARATQDLDILVSGHSEGLLDRLQLAGRLDLTDRLRFDISTEPEDLRTIEGDGVLYEGYRFRVTAVLAGRPYGDRFGLDVVFGAPPVGTVDELDGPDLLAFAGIPPRRHRLYPRELHVAEKLHAYTMPRPRPNGRVKDLPDMGLLARTGSFRMGALREAMDRTFTSRGTHPVPAALPIPSEHWAKPYARLARINRLPWATLEQAHAAASAFLNPALLATSSPNEWSSSTLDWK